MSSRQFNVDEFSSSNEVDSDWESGSGSSTDSGTGSSTKNAGGEFASMANFDDSLPPFEESDSSLSKPNDDLEYDFTAAAIARRKASERQQKQKLPGGQTERSNSAVSTDDLGSNSDLEDEATKGSDIDTTAETKKAGVRNFLSFQNDEDEYDDTSDQSEHDKSEDEDEDSDTDGLFSKNTRDHHLRSTEQEFEFIGRMGTKHEFDTRGTSSEDDSGSENVTEDEIKFMYQMKAKYKDGDEDAVSSDDDSDGDSTEDDMRIMNQMKAKFKDVDEDGTSSVDDSDDGSNDEDVTEDEMKFMTQTKIKFKDVDGDARSNDSSDDEDVTEDQMQNTNPMRANYDDDDSGNYDVRMIDKKGAEYKEIEFIATYKEDYGHTSSDDDDTSTNNDGDDDNINNKFIMKEPQTSLMGNLKAKYEEDYGDTSSDDDDDDTSTNNDGGDDSINNKFIMKEPQTSLMENLKAKYEEDYGDTSSDDDDDDTSTNNDGGDDSIDNKFIVKEPQTSLRGNLRAKHEEDYGDTSEPQMSLMENLRAKHEEDHGDTSSDDDDTSTNNDGGDDNIGNKFIMKEPQTSLMENLRAKYKKDYGDTSRDDEDDDDTSTNDDGGEDNIGNTFIMKEPQTSLMENLKAKYEEDYENEFMNQVRAEYKVLGGGILGDDSYIRNDDDGTVEQEINFIYPTGNKYKGDYDGDETSSDASDDDDDVTEQEIEFMDERRAKYNDDYSDNDDMSSESDHNEDLVDVEEQEIGFIDQVGTKYNEHFDGMSRDDGHDDYSDSEEQEIEYMGRIGTEFNVTFLEEGEEEEEDEDKKIKAIGRELSTISFEEQEEQQHDTGTIATSAPASGQNTAGNEEDESESDSGEAYSDRDSVRDHHSDSDEEDSGLIDRLSFSSRRRFMSQHAQSFSEDDEDDGDEDNEFETSTEAVETYIDDTLSTFGLPADIPGAHEMNEALEKNTQNKLLGSDLMDSFEQELTKRRAPTRSDIATADAGNDGSDDDVDGVSFTNFDETGRNSDSDDSSSSTSVGESPTSSRRSAINILREQSMSLFATSNPDTDNSDKDSVHDDALLAETGNSPLFQTLSHETSHNINNPSRRMPSPSQSSSSSSARSSHFSSRTNELQSRLAFSTQRSVPSPPSSEEDTEQPRRGRIESPPKRNSSPRSDHDDSKDMDSPQMPQRLQYVDARGIIDTPEPSSSPSATKRSSTAYYDRSAGKNSSPYRSTDDENGGNKFQDSDYTDSNDSSDSRYEDDDDETGRIIIGGTSDHAEKDAFDEEKGDSVDRNVRYDGGSESEEYISTNNTEDEDNSESESGSDYKESSEFEEYGCSTTDDVPLFTPTRNLAEAPSDDKVSRSRQSKGSHSSHGEQPLEVEKILSAELGSTPSSQEGQIFEDHDDEDYEHHDHDDNQDNTLQYSITSHQSIATTRGSFGNSSLAFSIDTAHTRQITQGVDQNIQQQYAEIDDVTYKDDEESKDESSWDEERRIGVDDLVMHKSGSEERETTLRPANVTSSTTSLPTFGEINETNFDMLSKKKRPTSTFNQDTSTSRSASSMSKSFSTRMVEMLSTTTGEATESSELRNTSAELMENTSKEPTESTNMRSSLIGSSMNMDSSNTLHSTVPAVGEDDSSYYSSDDARSDTQESQMTETYLIQPSNYSSEEESDDSESSGGYSEEEEVLSSDEDERKDIESSMRQKVDPTEKGPDSDRSYGATDYYVGLGQRVAQKRKKHSAHSILSGSQDSISASSDESQSQLEGTSDHVMPSGENEDFRHIALNLINRANSISRHADEETSTAGESDATHSRSILNADASGTSKNDFDDEEDGSMYESNSSQSSQWVNDTPSPTCGNENNGNIFGSRLLDRQESPDSGDEEDSFSYESEENDDDSDNIEITASVSNDVADVVQNIIQRAAETTITEKNTSVHHDTNDREESNDVRSIASRASYDESSSQTTSSNANYSSKDDDVTYVARKISLQAIEPSEGYDDGHISNESKHRKQSLKVDVGDERIGNENDSIDGESVATSNFSVKSDDVSKIAHNIVNSVLEASDKDDLSDYMTNASDVSQKVQNQGDEIDGVDDECGESTISRDSSTTNESVGDIARSILNKAMGTSMLDGIVDGETNIDGYEKTTNVARRQMETKEDDDHSISTRDSSVKSEDIGGIARKILSKAIGTSIFDNKLDDSVPSQTGTMKTVSSEDCKQSTSTSAVSEQSNNVGTIARNIVSAAMDHAGAGDTHDADSERKPPPCEVEGAKEYSTSSPTISVRRESVGETARNLVNAAMSSRNTVSSEVNTVETDSVSTSNLSVHSESPSTIARSLVHSAISSRERESARGPEEATQSLGSISENDSFGRDSLSEISRNIVDAATNTSNDDEIPCEENSGTQSSESEGPHDNLSYIVQTSDVSSVDNEELSLSTFEEVGHVSELSRQIVQTEVQSSSPEDEPRNERELVTQLTESTYGMEKSFTPNTSEWNDDITKTVPGAREDETNTDIEGMEPLGLMEANTSSSPNSSDETEVSRRQRLLLSVSDSYSLASHEVRELDYLLDCQENGEDFDEDRLYELDLYDRWQNGDRLNEEEMSDLNEFRARRREYRAGLQDQGVLENSEMRTFDDASNSYHEMLREPQDNQEEREIPLQSDVLPLSPVDQKSFSAIKAKEDSISSLPAHLEGLRQSKEDEDDLEIPMRSSILLDPPENTSDKSLLAKGLKSNADCTSSLPAHLEDLNPLEDDGRDIENVLRSSILLDPPENICDQTILGTAFSNNTSIAPSHREDADSRNTEEALEEISRGSDDMPDSHVNIPQNPILAAASGSRKTPKSSLTKNSLPTEEAAGNEFRENNVDGMDEDSFSSLATWELDELDELIDLQDNGEPYPADRLRNLELFDKWRNGSASSFNKDDLKDLAKFQKERERERAHRREFSNLIDARNRGEDFDADRFTTLELLFRHPEEKLTDTELNVLHESERCESGSEGQSGDSKPLPGINLDRSSKLESSATKCDSSSSPDRSPNYRRNLVGKEPSVTQRHMNRGIGNPLIQQKVYTDHQTTKETLSAEHESSSFSDSSSSHSETHSKTIEQDPPEADVPIYFTSSSNNPQRDRQQRGTIIGQESSETDYDSDLDHPKTLKS
eukprot:jgi/Psemu1/285694/fgenesh1_pg.99_\